MKGRVLGREVVPAEEAVAAGADAAKGCPAAGDGGERDVGFDGDVFSTAVAEYALPRLA